MSRFHEELYRQKGPKHDNLVIKCVSEAGINKIVEACNIHTLGPLAFHYETEVICESRGYKSSFILGYADIIISGYKPEHIKKNKSDINSCYARIKILVEVKPSLIDIGSTVRQLKTYESVMHTAYIDGLQKAIVTYSNVKTEVREYLKHEGITIVVFEEEP